ncbi:Uncharacterised protein [Mycoplasma putrefaciens]|uniref:Lipopolysaccharide assembly protein A domain-containing protein n=1 Tax=Mycoplasma putrefaciens (strain ATCC 15718 / NCTC 10155 / C30 KS-1 / KS-1) TaxID=743965 RepID=A0A7U3ZSJ6_MYCPK|nr:TIGR04561 family membrane protein [Mycoplasma putrefaciens]AEM68736.1 hypothetical protein MPUT_0359 [Mycoplasma putrefaciens KS1]SYV95963.1 Uncharacterised protein [Mycoplasma putrefaciens]
MKILSIFVIEIFDITIPFSTILLIFGILGSLAMLIYIGILLVLIRRKKNNQKVIKTELQKQLNLIDDEIISIINDLKHEKIDLQKEGD